MANKKTAYEARITRLERAAQVLRTSTSARVRTRPTFMDCGDSVSIRARAIGGDSVELWLLYPEGARALGEALIEAADRCRLNSKQPSVTSKNYLDEEI